MEDLKAGPWATHSQRAGFLCAVLGVMMSEGTVCRAVERHSEAKMVYRAAERDGHSHLMRKLLSEPASGCTVFYLRG